MTLPEKVRDVTQSEWLEVRERLAAAESQLALAMAWGAEVCATVDIVCAHVSRSAEQRAERAEAERDEAQRGRTSMAAVNAALRDYPDADVSALWVPASEALEYQGCWHRDVAKGRAALEKAEAERDAMRKERDEAGRDWEREHDRAAAREEQIEEAHAHTGCEREWTNLHDLGDCLARSVAEMAADLAAARAQLAQTEESLRLARNEILSGIDAEQLRVTREIQAARRDAERQRDVARSERDHAYDNADSIWAGVVGRLTKERDAARAQLAAVVAAATSINHCIYYSDTYQQWVLAYPDRTRPALDALRSAISDTAQAAREHDERVRAEERERCAKECEAYGRCAAERDATAAEKAADGLAAHIRALGSRP